MQQMRAWLRNNDPRYIKICHMTARHFSERSYLSRIPTCIQCTFVLFLSSQEYLNSWTQTQTKGVCRGASWFTPGKNKENKSLTVCHVLIKK